MYRFILYPILHFVPIKSMSLQYLWLGVANGSDQVKTYKLTRGIYMLKFNSSQPIFKIDQLQPGPMRVNLAHPA